MVVPSLSLLPLQPRSQICSSLLLCGLSKCLASSAHTLVCISLFKHKCFHTFSLDRIGRTVLLADCLYLPVPLCKLKAQHDVLADDTTLLALGKPLEKENGLNQNSFIEITIFGNSGAGVLLV